MLGIFRQCSRAALDAYYSFLTNDGWATASHIALSTLMALLAFLILLGPLIFATAVKFANWLAPLEWNFTVARYAIASVALIIALLIAHKWLPAGRRHLHDILPGILATLIMWLAAGVIFGRYLAEFAYTYVTYYAGLASAMIALVFLYLTASIFVYGGELNAAFVRLRRAR